MPVERLNKKNYVYSNRLTFLNTLIMSRTDSVVSVVFAIYEISQYARTRFIYAMVVLDGIKYF